MDMDVWSCEKGHRWISNTAFRRLTGIKRVCLICGAPDYDPQHIPARPEFRSK